ITAECAVDAQSLISISLRKIHNSRTQRGGIKLHKNLLVSYVLRNARQVYMNEKYAEIYRMQQYEEVMTVCNEIQELDPLDVVSGGAAADECEDAGVAEQQQCCAGGMAGGQASLCGAQPCSLPSAPEEACKTSETLFYRSCCAEPYPPPPPSPCDFSPAHCNKTTVLDLDTHVVTTVENGCLHQDCCCTPLQPCSSPSSKKRKVSDYSGCGYYAPELEDVSVDPAPCKRAKLEDCCSDCLVDLDTANISNLISIFGSGFSGLVSRQADFEQAFNGQFCSKQALASLGAWTRAIVAF
uniref:Immediate early response 5 like n=1 Tax=Astyanax mexicanus TaxID=7994 RepID=W5LTE4_ASTMX